MIVLHLILLFRLNRSYAGMKKTIKISLIVWGHSLLLLCILSSSAYAKDNSSNSQTEANQGAKSEKYSLIKTTILGAPESLEANLKAFLPSLRSLSCSSSENRIDGYIDMATEKLAEAAEAMGYFNSQYKITASNKNNCWSLDINVKSGETVKVTQQDIQLRGEGKRLKEFQGLLEYPPYQLGDTLVSQNYLDYKTRLKRTANNLGFFDAELSHHVIKVNPKTNQAAVELSFETGKRYHIGKIEVKQDILQGKYLQRYIRLREGDVFEADKIIHQQRLLEKSGYYKTVQVTAHYKEASNHLIPISITAVKRKRYTYKGTIGMSSDDGLFIELGSGTHWVNSKGHQLSVNSHYSTHDPSLSLSYKIPLYNPEFEYLNLSAGWKRSTNDDISGTALRLGVDYHRRNKNDWDQILSISYLDEKTHIGGATSLHSQLTLFGIGARKMESNDKLFPSKGWRFSADLLGAAEGFLSDQTLLQAKASGKYIHTLKNKDKLLLRGDMGTTLVGDINEMPKSLRFFAGGQSSVRGYSFESIGEANDEGDVIGGRNLLAISAEYEHSIMNKISAAAFVDAGAAFDDWGDYRMDVGVGVGVRYRSPLGPIRLDLAAPEGDPKDIKFYFSLGPDL